MHFNQLFIFLVFTIHNSSTHEHWILLRIRQVMCIRAQHSRPQGFDPCDKRRRSKGRVDDGTPQIKGFRISVQHQKLEAKRVMTLLRLRVILVPARALDPCRALAKGIRALGTRMAGKVLKTSTQLL